VTAPELRRSRAAIFAYFFVLGVAFAVWAARLPAIKQSLHLSDAQLGLALFAVPAGSVLTLALSGRIVDRFGAVRVLRIAGVLSPAALVLVGLAGNLAGLMATLAVYGALAGLLDVSMNACGARLELGYGRPIMSSLHAGYSIAGLAGAGIGGISAWLGVSPLPTFAATAAALVILGLLAGPRVALPEAEADADAEAAPERPDEPPPARRPRRPGRPGPPGRRGRRHNEPARLEQGVLRHHAAHGLVVQGDAADAAVDGQGAGLRPDLLGREYALHRGQQRVPVEQVQVSCELLYAVNLAAALDLHRDALPVRVPAHQVDRPDRGRLLAPDQPTALAEPLELDREQLLQVRLDPVLDQARVDAELDRDVAHHLGQRDDQALTRLPRHRPLPRLLGQPARRRHPVQRLVRAAVGVHEHRAVGLDDEQAQGLGQVGGEPADVVDAAPGDDEPHDR